jgi:Mg2+ and Co2+ transporter CorA
MQLRFIGPDGLAEHPTDAVSELLRRPDGVVWLDVPRWDGEAEHLLREVFGFHPRALSQCAQRNRVPTFEVYADHVFLVLHSPHAGAPGHVHSIELDPFVGERFLVTVHGPLSSAADPAAAQVEVTALAALLAAGDLSPQDGYELSYALTSTVAQRLGAFIAELTAGLWDLEYRFQAVVSGGPSARLREPEQFLDVRFRARHGFLVARTQAATSREVFTRMQQVGAFGEGAAQKRIEDIADQLGHLCALADVEKDNLQGTIEFYQARTNTELTLAAERLAVIAAVTLPVTAVSSILGMNLIVNGSTQPAELAVAVLLMGAMSFLLLVWAKRQGWW